MKTTKQFRRTRRKAKIRAKLSGTSERPRLVVFRSNRFTYAQIIDDTAGKVLASASDNKSTDKTTKTDSAKVVGQQIAEAAKAKKITAVVFDRNGYKYHGRVKALADGAREGGLTF